MGIDNLIPVTKRSKEEARALSKKGGINSGKARRRKKAEKEANKRIAKIMQQLLVMQLNEQQISSEKLLTRLEDVESLEELSRLDLPAKIALALSLIKQGLSGNIKAIELVFRMAGDNTESCGSVSIKPVIIAVESEIKK